MLKTNREITATCGPCWHYTVPAGAEVTMSSEDSRGRTWPVIREPRKYGVNDHDAEHYYMFVPRDAIEEANQ